jgi:LAGLIDADG endonuclease
MAGFTSSEGCLFIKTSKSKTHKLGMCVTLNFFITQDIRDAYLLESFSQVFGCGSFSIVEKSGIGRFAV